MVIRRHVTVCVTVGYFYVVVSWEEQLFYFFFFFNDTATTEIYTLSLHDALPILQVNSCAYALCRTNWKYEYNIHIQISRKQLWHHKEIGRAHVWTPVTWNDLVCRLLLEKKKTKQNLYHLYIITTMFTQTYIPFIYLIVISILSSSRT